MNYGYIILFKTAYSICQIMEEKLMNLKLEEAVFNLRNCIDKFDEELLIQKVLENKLTKEKFEKHLSSINKE